MTKLQWAKLLVGFLVLCAVPTRADAAGSNVFSVYPEYPENQIDVNAGYYYFSAAPGETMTLTANAVNETDSDILLYVESADTYTSPSGELVYMTQNASTELGYADESFMMGQHIAASTDSLILKPGESSAVQITVDVPDIARSEFIGAVRFYTLSLGEAQQSGASAGVDVTVKSAQVMPIRVVTGELAPSGPAVIIGDVSFDEAQNGYYFTVENKLPMIGTLNSLSYDTTGPSGETAASGSISPVKLAPRTIFRVYLDLVSSIPPGEYSLNVSYLYQQSETRESRAFSVSNQEAGALPTPSQSAATPSGGVYISTGAVIMAVLGAVIIVLLIFLLTRRGKRHPPDGK